MLQKYNLETNLNLNVKDSKMLLNINNKKQRNIFLSSFISNYNTIKQRPRFFQLISLFSQISTNKLQDPLFKFY